MPPDARISLFGTMMTTMRWLSFIIKDITAKRRGFRYGYSDSFCTYKRQLRAANVEDVIEIYDEIRAQYPNAAITATDLNGMAEVVLAVKDSLPVVTEEMGILGFMVWGTDPRKVSGYRSLLRLRSQFSETDRRKMENI